MGPVSPGDQTSVIPFKRPLLSLILQGTKTQTRRNPHYQYSLGKTYGIGDEWSRGPVARVLITRKYRQRLGDMTDEEIAKEGFPSLEAFQTFWEKNVGPWEPGKTVIAYEFERVIKG